MLFYEYFNGLKDLRDIMIPLGSRAEFIFGYLDVGYYRDDEYEEQVKLRGFTRFSLISAIVSG